MKRRKFVVGATAVSLTAGLAVWYRANGRGPKTLPAGSGLRPDPAGILDLPPGFRYRVLQKSGQMMSDGYRVPARPDAMACFAGPDGGWVLMRNHELDRSVFGAGPYGPEQKPPAEAYDAESLGGVTRVVLDTNGKVRSSNAVLLGTARNCAGGMSPWGFLSCEETVTQGHGYVFLCAPEADRVRPPQRIDVYGRLQHEAVAIDPRTNAAYLTEDRAESCLYRYVPQASDQPFGQGRFQALAVKSAPRFVVGDALAPKKRHAIHWVDVPLSAGETDALREKAQARGAAIVRRGEGIWFADDGVYVVSTTGGPVGKGQVFHVGIDGDVGTLSLVAQADEHTPLDMPDNITVTPWGDLLVCEDNHRDAYLRLITPQGKVVPFAHNALSASELAGVCFSPDGRFVFVNIQENGLTLAIEGPFDTLRHG